MRRHYIIQFFFASLILMTVHAEDERVAHWSFNKIKGDTIFDESPYANHGTNYGADIIDGVHGKALSFNGISDYARIPADGQNPPAVLKTLGMGSISVWFRVDEIPMHYGIAPIFYYGSEGKCDFFDAANQGLIIEVGHSPIHYASKRVYFTIWKNGCTYPSFCYDSREGISTEQWHHLVVVVGEDYNTGYLNGVEMTDRRYNFGNSSYSQFFEDAVVHEKLWLGKGHWDRTDQHFNGAIDELSIYNYPLSSNEVKTLYENTSGKETSVLNRDDNQLKMKFRPNPASSHLFYDIGNFTDQKIFRLTDITGKITYIELYINGQGILDISQVPEGIYLTTLSGGRNSVWEKLVIKR